MTLRRGAAAAALGIVLLGSVLAGCGGERPSLGAAPTTTERRAGSATGASMGPASTAPSTTGAATEPSTGAPVPTQAVLDPSTLLGYIATPSGKPVVHTTPDDSSPTVDIGATTEAGAPTNFAVVGDPTTASTGWYRVVLPTRPNGGTGWVPAGSVSLSKTPFRIFVDLQARQLRAEKDGATVLEAPVAIGTTTNPTPTGGTFVTELIRNTKPQGSYGPYAFGLALHSDTLTEFAGGPGQVGIHGTNQPAKIGQRVSHGCIRLRNADIEALVGLQLPLGVPVFIT